MNEAWSWATAEFGQVELSDSRRTARLVAMGAAACERPSGKVAAVFGTDREREGAYDFLENEQVAPEEIMAGVAEATLRRSEGLPFVYVPIDGTSITVVDRAAERDFGSIGSTGNARGLKIIDALAVDPEGTAIGWLALTFWARTKRAPPQGSRARAARPVEEKETQRWIDTVRAAKTRLDEYGQRGWFQIDREGDGRDVLLELAESGHWWTVRGARDRGIELEGGTGRLRSELGLRTAAGEYELAVVARVKRRARAARMVVRVAQVVLRLRRWRDGAITPLPITAVWAREEGTTPDGEQPIDWLLYTNRAIETLDDAKLVIHGYAQRWRIEECHRTWKSGQCDIESTQLRSFAAVQRWAIILGAVATRIERLKRISRINPSAPGSIELTPIELRALKMLKFGAAPPDREPTIADAVSWLAELGGYANKYSGKPPGAVVLGRGLRYLRPAAHMLSIQEGRGATG